MEERDRSPRWRQAWPEALQLEGPKANHARTRKPGKIFPGEDGRKIIPRRAVTRMQDQIFGTIVRMRHQMLMSTCSKAPALASLSFRKRERQSALRIEATSQHRSSSAVHLKLASAFAAGILAFSGMLYLFAILTCQRCSLLDFRMLLQAKRLFLCLQSMTAEISYLVLDALLFSSGSAQAGLKLLRRSETFQPAASFSRTLCRP